MKIRNSSVDRLMGIEMTEDSFEPRGNFEEMKEVHFIQKRLPDMWRGRRDINARTIIAIARSPKTVFLAECFLKRELEKVLRNYEDENRLFPDSFSKETFETVRYAYGGIVTLDEARARAYHLDAQSDAAMLVPTVEGGIFFGEAMRNRGREISAAWKESVGRDTLVLFMGYAALFGEKWQRRIYEMGCAPLALYNKSLERLQWCLVVNGGDGWEWPTEAKD